MGSARLMPPCTPRVAPLATVVATPVVPSALAWAATRVPALTVVLPL